MKFKQFFEIFGQFVYSVPVDKEQQIYDFYMLSLLRGITNKKYVGQFKGANLQNPYKEPGSFEPGSLEDPESQAEYMLEEVSEKLLPFLKKELSYVIAYSVCSEIGKLFEIALMQDKNQSKNWKKIVNKYHSNYSKNFNQFLKEIPDHPKLIYKIASNFFPNMEGFLAICKTLFLRTNLENFAFGGSAWVNIINSYFMLQRANRTNELITAIDHVYDLQHNTGSIFSKHDSYAKGSPSPVFSNFHNLKIKYDWIEKALDHKRDATGPEEFLEKVSPQMKKLASRIIKIKNL